MSSTVRIPAGFPSTPTAISPVEVCAAIESRSPVAIPRPLRNERLPIRISLPSIRAEIPPPGQAVKSVTVLLGMPRFSAARMTARARGCSLPRSAEAASDRSSGSVKGSRGWTSESSGLPAVRVPVLSRASRVAAERFWSEAASRTRMPCRAARPMPTMSAIGVARPSAQGQAMRRTETADRSPISQSPASKIQQIRVMTESPSTTGTKTEATRSANCWTGARLRCACATVAMMPERRVPAPAESTRNRKLPCRFNVPAETRDPVCFSSGSGSPVSIDSSTELHPSVIVPSAGIFSPGRMRSRSPGRSVATETSRSPSGVTRSAFGGVRSSSSRSEEPARARPRASSH